MKTCRMCLTTPCSGWHFRMLDDARRNQAYADAIAVALADLPADQRTVLDIGTGTGLLAMLATRAGATQAWACDCSTVMAEL
eukprot:5536_4